MALKTYRPTSPGLRQLVLVDRGHLWKGGPVKVLVEGKSKTGGRNNFGRITTRHIGGGHKQSYRLVDFRRRKFDVTAASLVPKPEIVTRDPKCKTGVIYFGATRPGVLEGLDELATDGFKLNSMRLRAFPFNADVKAFCDKHDRIFVVEQNRDGQMRTLLMVEADIAGEKLVSVLNYDGTPMTAHFVRSAILKHLRPAKKQAAE